jgi:hypothetical protein
MFMTPATCIASMSAPRKTTDQPCRALIWSTVVRTLLTSFHSGLDAFSWPSVMMTSCTSRPLSRCSARSFAIVRPTASYSGVMPRGGVSSSPIFFQLFRSAHSRITTMSGVAPDLSNTVTMTRAVIVSSSSIFFAYALHALIVSDQLVIIEPVLSRSRLMSISLFVAAAFFAFFAIECISPFALRKWAGGDRSSASPPYSQTSEVASQPRLLSGPLPMTIVTQCT